MHLWIYIRSRVTFWMLLSLGKVTIGTTASAALPYPVCLPLWDATYASIEVQMLFSSEQIIQCIHLRTVADVNSLFPALHDVYQMSGGKTHTKKDFLKQHSPHDVGQACRVFQRICCLWGAILLANIHFIYWQHSRTVHCYLYESSSDTSLR